MRDLLRRLVAALTGRHLHRFGCVYVGTRGNRFSCYLCGATVIQQGYHAPDGWVS